jgi:putative colanic acid biosynthesis UDP-glucose lipid carrier transferase
MNAFSRHIAASLSREIPSRAERHWPIRYQAIELLAALTDIAAILLSSLFAALITHIGGQPTDFEKAMGEAIIVSALFVCSLRIAGLYRPIELMGLRSQVRAIGLAWTSVFVMIAAVRALDIGWEFPRGMSLFAALGLATLVAHRVVTKQILVKGLSGRKFASRRVVLISDPLQSPTTGLPLSLAIPGFTVAKNFSLPPPGAGLGYRKQLSACVIDYVRDSDVEEIIIEADLTRWSELRSFADDLRVLPFPIKFVPLEAGAELFLRRSDELGCTVCVELQRGPLTPMEYAAKRTLDVVGAGLALLLLAPLLLAAAIAIKLDSPGPVLFRQQRCGFNGRSFTILKFRTMYVLEDGSSVVQARPVDERVTRVGKWLRRISIDELPQLLNVLGGSMCLVGPRPHALAHENQFDKLVRNYAFRRRAKPGLTGWAQVHGYRGPTPTIAMIERRVEYDLWYIDNWSMSLDLAILLLTPIEVLRARNAY